MIDGHGVMDESYLTGEPFQITKTRCSRVISGAINGESALTIRTTQRAADSRYAKIMHVMRESESSRPTLRRLGDRLGANYTPVALTVAVLAWAMTGDALRFLAVMVIATPYPAGTNWLLNTRLVPTNSRLSAADSNAGWRLTGTTRRPCAFAMHLARTVCPS